MVKRDKIVVFMTTKCDTITTIKLVIAAVVTLDTVDIVKHVVFTACFQS